MIGLSKLGGTASKVIWVVPGLTCIANAFVTARVGLHLDFRATELSLVLRF